MTTKSKKGIHNSITSLLLPFPAVLGRPLFLSRMLRFYRVPIFSFIVFTIEVKIFKILSQSCDND